MSSPLPFSSALRSEIKKAARVSGFITLVVACLILAQYAERRLAVTNVLRRASASTADAKESTTITPDARRAPSAIPAIPHRDR